MTTEAEGDGAAEIFTEGAPYAKASGGRNPGIYVVRVGRYVKIGCTGDLRRRIREIDRRFGCKFPDDIEDVPAELVGTLWGGGDCERALHQAFSDLHVIGEWFRYEGRMVDWCAKRRGVLPPLPGDPVVF